MRKWFASLFLILLCVAVALGGGPRTTHNYEEEFGFGHKKELGARNSALRQSASGKLRSSFGFLRGVGGIASVATASPHAGFSFDKLSLRFDRQARGAKRFTVLFDEQPYSLDYPDDIVLPVARYVQSGTHAILSLTAEPSSDEERAFRENRGLVVSYHDAFFNTRLGRLFFYADAMFVGGGWTNIRKAVDLSEDPTRNPKEAASVLDTARRLLQGNGFDSYILQDEGVTYTFSTVPEEQRVLLLGSPYYYFWMEGPSQSVLPAGRLTKQFRDEIKLTTLCEQVYRPVFGAMRLAAFFRFVKATNQGAWDEFMRAVEAELRDPACEVYADDSPRGWKPRLDKEALPTGR